MPQPIPYDEHKYDENVKLEDILCTTQLMTQILVIWLKLICLNQII